MEITHVRQYFIGRHYLKSRNITRSKVIALWMCAFFGFLCAPGQAPGQPQPKQFPAITGRAIVIDGDTIEIAGRRIRLQGIDAPESAQNCMKADGSAWPCGRHAAIALDAMIGTRPVSCHQDPRDPEDRYGRTLAMCRVVDGVNSDTDLQLYMLKSGYAVAYTQYLDYRDGSSRPHKALFLATQEQARREGLGVWQGPFMMPWHWRAPLRQ